MDPVKYVTHHGQEYLMPTHLLLEVVRTKCNVRCIMCAINESKRSPMIMSDETVRVVAEQFLPYREHIQFVSFHGNGEPLLDRGFARKVAYLKSMGYRGFGVSTNCTILSRKKARELMNAGLNTIICSVDGFRKETQEKIRVGTKHEIVVRNVLDCIALRNEMDSAMKIMVRFVRQELNQEEWPEYQAFWQQQLNPDKGDRVLRFDAFDMTSQLKKVEESEQNEAGQSLSTDGVPSLEPTTEGAPLLCQELYHRMIVFADGHVSLCCNDQVTQFDGVYRHGNVHERHALELYSGEHFTHYRQMMEAGRIRELELCRRCTIPKSHATKLAC